MTVLDLFAGCGGWDLGARSAGVDPVDVEIDGRACETRWNAGLATWQQDVAAVTDTQVARFAGRVDGIIASPPCTDFSVAGRRAGIGGATGRLMLEVPRWVAAIRPRWVACEQVPPALPWWDLLAHQFRRCGYWTWTGVLCAADYGVPQVRRRAFLVASLDGPVSPPFPSHSEHGGGVFGLERWVSMGDALGLDADLSIVGGAWSGAVARCVDQPSPTLCTGNDPGGWVWTRPATTVQATPRIAKPGHHDVQFDGCVKVTIEQMLVLQGFPADYPVAGSKVAKAKQVGNAVPPPLAAAVIRSVAP